MPEIRVLELKLRNFKGCKDYTFNPWGEDVTIYGRNKAGKTRLVDGTCWILFDKDSKGQSPSGKGKFNIKDTTIKDRGNVQGLDASGELVVSVDGRKVKLKKVYSENWGTTRSSTNKVLKGHSNSYWINDEPIPLKKGYDAFIEANIATEEQFKFITALGYFCDNRLHPIIERRNFLFKMGGNPTDQEIINSNPALSELSNLLEGKSIDSFKNIVKDQEKELTKEKVKIPIQISEVELGLPDIKGIDVDKEKSFIDDIDINIKAENALLNQLESGGAIAEKTNQMKIIQSEMFELKTTHRGTIQVAIDKVEKERRELTGKLEEVSRKGIAFEGNIIDCLEKINRHNESIKILRTSWTEKNDTEFYFERDETCPTCGQQLPQEHRQAAYDKALACFNIKKAEELEAITAHGQELSAKVKRLETVLADTEKDAKSAAKEQVELQSKIDALNKSLEPLNLSRENYRDEPEYTLLAAKYASIEQEIITLKNGSKPETTKIDEEISRLESKKKLHQQAINDVNSCEKGVKRKSELDKKEKTLNAQIEELNRRINLCDMFTTSKVAYTEDKINSLFKVTKWKLFEKQVNGLIDDRVCEPMHEGVAYSVDLNDGGKVLVDLDISNTLAKYYRINLFKFVDNTESVTEALESDGQLIKLFASEKDKTLRVEIEKPALAAEV